MIVKIFTGPLNYDIKSLYKKDNNEYLIGVDQACELLVENEIHFDLAIGDFDSLNISIEKISSYAETVTFFNELKDETDTYLAVEEAMKLLPDEITIYGGTGRRLDHTYANMLLLQKGNIKMITKDMETYILNPGIHQIDNKYKYLSVYAVEKINSLTLKGFKYEIEDIVLDTSSPLGTSNEGEGIISFTSGKLLVIHTNE